MYADPPKPFRRVGCFQVGKQPAHEHATVDIGDTQKPATRCRNSFDLLLVPVPTGLLNGKLCDELRHGKIFDSLKEAKAVIKQSR